MLKWFSVAPPWGVLRQMPSVLELKEQLQAVERRLERERSVHSKIALASEKSRLQMELVHAAKGTQKVPATEVGPCDEPDRTRRVRFGSTRKPAGAVAQHAVSAEERLADEAVCRASRAVVWKDQSDPLADTLNGRRRDGKEPKYRRSKHDDADASARKKSPERMVLRDSGQPTSARRPSTADRSGTEWKRLSETQGEIRAGSSELTEPQSTKVGAPRCAVCAHRQHLGLEEDDRKMCAACLLYQPASTEACWSRARSSSPMARRLIDRSPNLWSAMSKTWST